ncbi:sigma 54-interacting transcriptional regulator [Desulfomonile tiedjei]|uniref:PAS domain S-box n=1 Tax=Desulfomonile tiedjei (strain ATCC 49306 / DSM 6799 / DCB-1) TaxID=706587 RepID=I4CBT5_DESTA|nr:sigma 54-interacting transcriptional regulator [Desulfomonile tiedjei]AFM27026.1 PAS domain S-box [Desulfomonile tiedjei DSM 6799]AFM28152.1 PAS domain S-box [Desulfomonile tiedjei DSM 6799]
MDRVCRQTGSNTHQLLIGVLQNIDAAVWVTDKLSDEILFANVQAEEVLGEQERIKDNGHNRCLGASSGMNGLSNELPHEAVESLVHDLECEIVQTGRSIVAQELEIDWVDGRKALLTIARDSENMNRREEEYAESEAIRTTLRKVIHGIFVVNDSGGLTQVDAAWEQMFGYSAEEALFLRCRDMMHPEYSHIFEEKFKAVLCGDAGSFRMKKLFARKDGSLFWGDLSITRMRSLGGRVGAAVGIIAEMSERTQAQRELRESEANFRAAIDNLGQAVTMLSDTKSIMYVNAAFERMFGYSAEEAKCLTPKDVSSHEDFDASNEKLQSLIRGEIDFYRLEKRYMRKDGSVFWGDVTCTPIRDPDSRVEAAVAVIVDITERKRAEEEARKILTEQELRIAENTKELAWANRELRVEVAERRRAQEALQRFEEQFSAIIRTSTDCVFIKDESLKYVIVNPSMEKLLNLPASEIIKLQDKDLFGQEAADRLHELDTRVLSGESVEMEHTRPINNLPMRFLEIRAPIRDKDGRIAGICGIFRRITERAAHASESSIQDSLSPVMRAVVEEARVAAMTDIIVLITGESGAGKDYLARFIHDNSARANGPFYTLNCAAIPPELAESELFGHEPGAFTGANKRKKGLLELAEGGTLLLNEIGELPTHLQAKLLTFLDNRSFTRVGGEKPVKVNARLLAATNRNLKKEVLKKRFRRDLFYRLNVLSLRVPSLVDRIEDLPALAEQIISELGQKLKLPTRPTVPPEELAKLCGYKWPGNIRELRNVLERALIVSPGPQLQFDFLESEAAVPTSKYWIVHFPPRPSYVDVVAGLKRNLLLEALASSGGSKSEACRLLGISRHMLRRQLDTFKLT